MGLPEYLYRCDSLINLVRIKKEGFKCGFPSREPIQWATDISSSVPAESRCAGEKGFLIPTNEILFLPRIYVFWRFQVAFEQVKFDINTLRTKEVDICYTAKVVIRFSSKISCFANENLYFADGLFINPNEAAYVVLPDNKVGDVIIKAKEIEVFTENNKWVNLQNYYTLKELEIRLGKHFL